MTPLLSPRLTPEGARALCEAGHDPDDIGKGKPIESRLAFWGSPFQAHAVHAALQAWRHEQGRFAQAEQASLLFWQLVAGRGLAIDTLRTLKCTTPPALVAGQRGIIGSIIDQGRNGWLSATAPGAQMRTLLNPKSKYAPWGNHASPAGVPEWWELEGLLDRLKSEAAVHRSLTIALTRRIQAVPASDRAPLLRAWLNEQAPTWDRPLNTQKDWSQFIQVQNEAATHWNRLNRLPDQDASWLPALVEVLTDPQVVTPWRVLRHRCPLPDLDQAAIIRAAEHRWAGALDSLLMRVLPTQPVGTFDRLIFAAAPFPGAEVALASLDKVAQVQTHRAQAWMGVIHRHPEWLADLERHEHAQLEASPVGQALLQKAQVLATSQAPKGPRPSSPFRPRG